MTVEWMELRAEGLSRKYWLLAAGELLFALQDGG